MKVKSLDWFHLFLFKFIQNVIPGGAEESFELTGKVPQCERIPRLRPE